MNIRQLLHHFPAVMEVTAKAQWDDGVKVVVTLRGWG